MTDREHRRHARAVAERRAQRQMDALMAAIQESTRRMEEWAAQQYEAALAGAREQVRSQNADYHLMPKGEEALHETLGASCRCEVSTEPVECEDGAIRLLHVHARMSQDGMTPPA